MPPWLAAVLTVSGMVLVIAAVPVLVSAVVPGGPAAASVAFSSEIAAPSVLPTVSSSASASPSAAPRAKATTSSSGSECPTARTESAHTPSPTPKSTPSPAASPRAPARTNQSSPHPTSATSQTFGTPPPGYEGRAVAVALTGDVSPGGCPLPKSGGGDTLLKVALGIALLFGGIAVLAMIGFSGARPWPGTYVRRI
jgi:hypothetical protein